MYNQHYYYPYILIISYPYSCRCTFQRNGKLRLHRYLIKLFILGRSLNERFLKQLYPFSQALIETIPEHCRTKFTHNF